jgi:hypothetical protein
MVPTPVLRRIKDVLNQVAKSAPALDTEITSAINLARQELFVFFPTDPRIAVRSTDGPSCDEVFQAGFRLGARAVVANSECADLGAPSTEAFDIAIAWLRSRRRAGFAKLVDGADPEYDELAQAFASGIELGVNRFLGFVREDHEDQELPEI